MGETLYDLIAANKRKTFLFILITTLFLAVLGYTIIRILDWGLIGYLGFAVFIILYNVILYYNSDKLALSSTGSVPADPEEFKMLHNVVEEVSIAAGIPKPKVYITPSPAPNAFATGRNPQNASVAVTTGLLEIMNRQELQGVIAHEIAHIRNYDILLMTVVAAIGGLIILLRDFLLPSQRLLASLDVLGRSSKKQSKDRWPARSNSHCRWSGPGDHRTAIRRIDQSGDITPA